MALRESDMSKPLEEWIRGQGYEVYVEVPDYYCNRRFDMVGRKGDDLLIIEMKTSLTKGVIHQAQRATMQSRKVYCAVASDPKQAGIDRCAEMKVGVLRVIGDAVMVLLEAGEASYWKWDEGLPNSIAERYRQKLRDRLERMEEGGIAGKPSEKGEGPAQKVYRQVLECRRQNPKATWREMYEAIPNHYASAQSMGSSMVKLERFKAWDGARPEELLFKPAQDLARLLKKRRERKDGGQRGDGEVRWADGDGGAEEIP